MIIYDLLVKNLKRLVRDKSNLIFIIIFPVLLMLLYSVTLSGSLIDLDSVQVGVVNLDEGNSGSQLIAALDKINHDGGNDVIKWVQLENESQGLDKLNNEEISSMIIVPENYSASSGNNSDTGILIEGDPTSTNYLLSITSIQMFLNEYSKEVHENISNDHINEVNLISKPLEGMDSFNFFDYMAPGLIVFSLLINISSIASNISEECEDGMLRRLKLSKMKSRDYVISTILSWILIGIIEIVVVFLIAVLLGFHWQGGLISIAAAVFTGALTLISSISLAIMIVSITNSTSQTVSLSALISIPLSVICGSLFPLPEFCIGSINGHPVQIYEILPWNQAVTILRQLLTFGKGLNELWINIALVAVIGFALLAVSVVLFNRKLDKTV